MSLTPEQVARVTPPIGSDWDIAKNRDHVASDAVGKLSANDLTATVTGREGLWVGYKMLAGFPVDHGEVADEAAMVALHNWVSDPLTTPVYHYVQPGDSCTRADDPDYRWHCLAGHGQWLAQWERRPLAAALVAKADLAALSAYALLDSPTFAGNPRMPVIRPINDASGWSTPIYYDGTGYIQLRKNATSGALEWTPDGGTTVNPMGGGGSASPTTTKGDLIVRGVDEDVRLAAPANGQIFVADSSEDTGWRAAAVVAPPLTANSVAVSNGTAWEPLVGTQGQCLVFGPGGVPVAAQVIGITWNPSTGQPSINGTTVSTTWSYNGDANGIFYYLGTNGLRQSWIDPGNYGPRIRLIDGGGTAIYTQFNRASNSDSGQTSYNIDMGANRQIAPASYTLKSGGSRIPRRWKLQGTNDIPTFDVTSLAAASWTDIDDRSAADDTSIGAINTFGHFVCNGDTTTRFRYIRYLHIKNSTSDTYVPVGELEFYGATTILNQSLASGTVALAYASQGDGQGLAYYLGTLARSTAWTNPMRLQFFAYATNSTSAGTTQDNFFQNLFNRDSIEGASSLAFTTFSGSWLCWDAGERRTFALNAYTMRQSSDTSAYLRSWVWEGSNNVVAMTTVDINAATWTVIDTRTSDTTLAAAQAWGTWSSLTGDTSTPFRFLRLRLVANSTGNTLYLGEVELYGSLYGLA